MELFTEENYKRWERNVSGKLSYRYRAKLFFNKIHQCVCFHHFEVMQENIPELKWCKKCNKAKWNYER